MEPTEHREDRRTVKLLTTLVVLMAVLIVGLATGGTLAWREYGRARASMHTARTDGEASARDLLAEVASRQKSIASELSPVVKDASHQIAQFDRRAAQLRRQAGGGPVDTAKRAVEMTQLMADELLLQLKMMATLERVLERASKPLPAQRGLLGSNAGVQRERPR